MKDYEEMILNNIRGKFKLSGNLNVRASGYGDKITLDGINYFNEINEVEILYGYEVIMKYDIKKAQIKIKRNINNVVVKKEVVNILNNYIGKEMYRLSNKDMKDLIRIERKKDEIYELEGSCGLDSYEVGEMLRLGF